MKHTVTGLLYRRYEIKHAFRDHHEEEYERVIHNGDTDEARKKLETLIGRWTTASGFSWVLLEEKTYTPWGDGEPTGTAWVRFSIPGGRPFWKMTGVPRGHSDQASELLWALALKDHPEAKFVYGSSTWPSHGKPFRTDRTVPYPTD